MYVSAGHGQNFAVKFMIRSIVICYLNEAEYILFLSYVLKKGTGFEPVKSGFPNAGENTYGVWSIAASNAPLQTLV